MIQWLPILNPLDKVGICRSENIQIRFTTSTPEAAQASGKNRLACSERRANLFHSWPSVKRNESSRMFSKLLIFFCYGWVVKLYWACCQWVERTWRFFFKTLPYGFLKTSIRLFTIRLRRIKKNKRTTWFKSKDNLTKEKRTC